MLTNDYIIVGAININNVNNQERTRHWAPGVGCHHEGPQQLFMTRICEKNSPSEDKVVRRRAIKGVVVIREKLACASKLGTDFLHTRRFIERVQ